MRYFILLLLFLCTGMRLFSTAAGMQEPDVYYKHSSLQWHWALDSLKHYSFKGDEKILDVGCRDGKVTALISKEIPKGLIIGIDVSTLMVDFATAALPASQYRNLLFTIGSPTDLPFRQQFDLIVSFCCLHWVEDQELALKSFCKSLVPNGKALIVVPAKASTNIATMCEALLRQKKWAQYFPTYKQERFYFTKEEYIPLLKAAQLTPISIEVSTSETIFENKRDFIEWLKPHTTFIQHLPQDLQEEFLKDLADYTLTINPPNSNGLIPFRIPKIEILCQKS
jgi:trans-aconitate 2-methyltransferase